MINNQFFKASFVVGFTLFLISCASFQQHSTQVKKPETDYRDYFYTTLDNGLKVLLISDKKAEQAAASMNIGVGSGYDPQDRQGLAHYLEHMLFLGTEKYPDASAYQSYITANGGNNNAYTSYEDTNYFFDIDDEYLEPALDRFAQFFIAPKFDAIYLEREKKAVDSEFALNIQDDSRRSLDAIKAVINPAHPFSKFSVGNEITLASRDGKSIRDELISFYDKYYYAQNMDLVVYGKESTEQLLAIVKDKFSKIPATAKQSLSSNDDQFNNGEPLFIKGSLPARLQVKSVKDIRTLSLMFPVPDEREHYETNAYYFISHLLGYEGKGSLLSELKRRGWVESLSAGGGVNFKDGALFQVSMSLTELGQKHQDQITQLFFQTVNTIRADALTAELYREQNKIAQTNFNYSEASKPYNLVSSLSRNLKNYKPSDVIYAPYMMENYNASYLKKMLSYIKPENLLLLTMSQQESATLKTSWYKTPYSFTPIQSKTLKKWKNSGLNSNIHAPRLNPYVVEDFSLVNHSNASTKIVQLEANQKLKLWQLPSNLNGLPKATINIRFQTPLVAQSPKLTVLNGMYSSLINDVINEENYDAYLTGLTLNFENNVRGINLNVSGFSDKQAKLIDSVLAQIKLPELNKERFDNIRKEYQFALKNSLLNKPYLRVFELFQTLMQRPYFSDADLNEALQSVSVTDLQQYIKEFWPSVSVEMFVNGNISEQNARQLASKITHTLGVNGQKKARVGVVKLAKKNENKMWTIPTQQQDAAYMRYIQGASTDPQERVQFMLTANILQALFYYQLRTEQQLGYLVNASYASNLGMPGLNFIIQSKKVDSVVLDKAVSLFLNYAYERFIKNMDSNDFNKYKSAIRAQLLAPPTSMLEQSSYYWQCISSHEPFDIKEQLAAALNQLSFEDWKKFYTQRFSKARVEHNLRLGTQSGDWTSAQRQAIHDWKQQQQVRWIQNLE